MKECFLGLTGIVAVVIPCYRVSRHILSVLKGIGPEVSLIYVVDDCCPEATGDMITHNVIDKRVTVISLSENLGVGGATKAGYSQAVNDGAEIIIKIDGDGQMDPGMIPAMLLPFSDQGVDYVKGNRFSSWRGCREMPIVRLLGNLALTFISRITSGSGTIWDATNGFTAIRTNILKQIPLSKVDNDFFFESDMLYWLSTVGASIVDIPMTAKYGTEESNLNVLNAIPLFAYKHTRNFVRRITP